MSSAKKSRITRRGFLIFAGVAGAGVVIGVKLGVPAARLKITDFLENSSGPPGTIEAEPMLWFEISPDNQVRVYIPKVEMGQGVHTALAQIAAEELDLAWEQVVVQQSGTGQGLDDGSGTGSSNSVSSLFDPLREAAATMRVMLQSEAARLIGVLPEQLETRAGGFYMLGESNPQLSYGEVAAQVEEWILPEETPALKAKADYHTIGQPIARVDLPEKITGRAVYGYDMRLEGKLYGAVARPPKIGAVFENAIPGTASGMPGVRKTVIEDDFAGIVADSRAQAQAAVAALEVEWDIPQTDLQQADIDTLVSVGTGKEVVIQRQGDVEKEFSGKQIIQAEYRTPMAYHAHLEPMAALADVTDTEVRVWTSTQSALRIRNMIADTLGRDPKQITVMPNYLGGGFGRKIGAEAAIEAARLSAAVGIPVHVGWSRAEDFQHGFIRPPTQHALGGVLNSTGKIEAIRHQQASGEVAFPFLPGFMKVVFGADFGSYRGALIQYATPNKETIAYLADLPLRTGWWRGLGLLANVFAVESFIDELAHVAGTDPLQFRIQHQPQTTNGQRMKKALEMAVQAAQWDQAPAEGIGRGVACCIDFGTIVVEAAEVAILEDEIQVQKVTAVVDPGLVINPDGARAQIEGAITMGLSSTLFEEVSIIDGVLEASNFDRYRILNMRSAPDIEVHLLESSERPSGMGEPPIGPIAAAVANAVFDLTGKRLRSLPLRLN